MYCSFFGYLQNSSDLLGLIQVMIVTFGEQPPVFAKPKEADIPYSSNGKLLKQKLTITFINNYHF